MNAVTATILIWHYYSQEHYAKNTPHGMSNAVNEGYQFLISNSLLERGYMCEDRWQEANITEKGRTMVDHWLATPMPVATTAWEIKR